MKKITLAFVAVLMFAFVQASPVIASEQLNTNTSFIELDQNKETSFVVSKEMPKKKKAVVRKGKRQRTKK